MKITGKIEQIFSQAVALDQSGGLKNTIYASGREVYVLNFDHTVLLRFRVNNVMFPQDVSFRANDYDSNDFNEQDGRIVFVSERSGYVRKKSCKVPDSSPDQMKKLFQRYVEEKSGVTVEVEFRREILELLDNELSHIEFVGQKGDHVKLIQRNIYSGGIVEVQEKGMMFGGNNLSETIEPLAMRTNDFVALFSFQDVLRFTFHSIGQPGSFVFVKSVNKDKLDMFGVISGCLYDEIIEMKEAM